MEDIDLLNKLKDAVSYVYETGRMSEREGNQKYGVNTNKLIRNKLFDLDAVSCLGYGDMTKNERTKEFIKYFDEQIKNTQLKIQDEELDRKSKKAGIEYAQKSIWISIISLAISILATIISLLI